MNHTAPEDEGRYCLWKPKGNLLPLLEHRGVMPLAPRHVTQRLLRQPLGILMDGRLAGELGQLAKRV